MPEKILLGTYIDIYFRRMSWKFKMIFVSFELLMVTFVIELYCKDNNVQFHNAKPRKVELNGGLYRVYDKACRVEHKIKFDKFQRNFSSFLVRNCSYSSR